jgi:proteasome beta subunit
MTVVLAVRCADGVVIGADSQITEGDRGLSYPAQKLHGLGDRAAWGGSGARSVLLDLEATLDAHAGAILEAEEIGHELQERMLPILKHHYENFIPEVPGEETGGGPSAYLLAAGYTMAGEQFIVQVDPHGMVSRYEDVGFHAIGSGAPMAQQAGTLLAHFRMVERDVRYGVIGVVRVLDALRVTSPSVGGPIDVARITPEGAEHLDEDAIEEAREEVAQWAAGEQRAMDDLFG